MMREETIFHEYFKKIDFIDRGASQNEDRVDVIIPIINTNDLFEQNLHSFYKEIPINQLIIGDAGSTDDSVKIAQKFPRVKIVDQSQHISLGFCIAELISLVETDWFIYLHADVYLPENWYDIMVKHKYKFDWFECGRRMTCLLEYGIHGFEDVERAFSGSQMGRKEAFKKIISQIDDDFLYRNEDIIFHELILAEGFNYGKIFDTFHYHQIMQRGAEREPNFVSVEIIRQKERDWEIKTLNMQLRGIIKYLKPKPYLIKEVNGPLHFLKKYNAINIDEFVKWVKKTDIRWLKYLNLKDLNPPPTLFQRIYRILIKKLNPLLKRFVA